MRRYKKPTERPVISKSQGQVLPIGVGLLAVAAITIFLVFNSGRSVNEKINLVNAADAAAYSGAQVAARHLNYMAYTNRAMIANEVAIGHMFSFQAEVDVVGEWTTNYLANGNNLLAQIITVFGLAPLVEGFVDTIVDGSKVVTSMLNLMYNANTAKFSNYQQQAYLDLLVQNENSGLSLIGETMRVVAEAYQVRPNAGIDVNLANTLNAFSSDGDAGVQTAATSAGSYNQDLCEMIMFAQPSADGTLSQVNQACDSLVAGNGAIVAAEEDGANMIELIRETYTNLDSGNWIQDRNHTYSTPFSFTAVREGQTDLTFENGHITWSTNSDLLTIAGETGSASGDVNSFIDEARAVVNRVGLQGLQDLGACDSSGQTEDGDSCGGLYNNEYRSIERYAVLNQDKSSTLVTAFLSQGNCSDSIGYDDLGNELPGWNNNLRKFDDAAPICNDTVYAVAMAEVFYQRPDCYDAGAGCGPGDVGFSSLEDGSRESANLYNPFWQVRLVSTVDQ